MIHLKCHIKSEKKKKKKRNQGPIVQNIVSLTSSLVVKMLTVLVSKIPNSQVFLLKKYVCVKKCKC